MKKGRLPLERGSSLFFNPPRVSFFNSPRAAFFNTPGVSFFTPRRAGVFNEGRPPHCLVLGACGVPTSLARRVFTSPEKPPDGRHAPAPAAEDEGGGGGIGGVGSPDRGA